MDVRYGLSDSSLVQNWSGPHQDICKIIHFSSQREILVEFHILDRKFGIDALKVELPEQGREAWKPKKWWSKSKAFH